jgi:putative nucleotidyltransferase with HDIG domain
MPVSIDERLWVNPSGLDQGRPSEDVAKNSMAALVGRVIGAKPFPETARRLAEMTRQPNARIGNAVRVLETDPALSARLLRLVNSPGYALRMRCTSLRHAAALVGLERLNHIATTAAVLDMFAGGSQAATELLDHSTVVGAFCRYFAMSLSLPADELFTCGFLHDIGKLLLLEAEGETYAELLASVPEDAAHLKERERFGFDHASLGAHVLNAWNIPHPVPLVVAWHHDRGLSYDAAPEIAAMIDTLRLSDEIAHAMSSFSDERARRTIADSETAAELNLTKLDLSRIWPELRQLREHCRAQRSSEMRVVDVASIRPSASLPPPSLPVETSEPEPTPEAAPPCAVCERPQAENTCSACAALVCGEHLDRSEWFCERCSRDFARSKKALASGLALKLGIGSAFVSLLLGAGFGAVQNGVPETLRVLVAPVLGLALSGVLLVYGQRYIVRARFLRSRRPAASSGAEIAAGDPPDEIPTEAAPPRTASLAPRPRVSGAVFTIPPSAYKVQIPGLDKEPLSIGSREVLLGSSRPPAAGPVCVNIEVAPQPRLLTTEPAPEAERRSAPLPAKEPEPALAVPEPAHATARRPFAAFARTPRRARRERRRDR